MQGKVTTEMYLNFKVKWIIDFSKELLPLDSLKKINFSHFETTIYEYYNNIILKSKDLDEVLSEFENANEVLNSLVKNNITDKKTQLLYVCMFKDDVIISWGNELTKSELLMKKLCMSLISTINIALELDQNVTLEATSKIAYKKAIKRVLEKINVGSDLLMSLEEKKIRLSKLFEEYETKNLKFVKKHNKNTNFNIRYIKIYAQDDSNTSMYLSKLNYAIKELSKENKKEVFKIASRSNVETNLMKIKLEIVTFNLFKEMLNGKNKIIFIDLPKDFLKLKTNCSFIEHLLVNVKDRIYLNINYDELLLYNLEFKSLKEKGIKFSVTKGEKEINFKKMYDIKYFFLKQEETISFNKTLTELKLGKIEPIITEFKNKTNDFNYYIK